MPFGACFREKRRTFLTVVRLGPVIWGNLNEIDKFTLRENPCSPIL